MTGERYTITLQCLLEIDVDPGVGWIMEDYDLTKLIPVKYRGRKFMLYSSFKTGNVGATTNTGLALSLTTIAPTYNVRTSYVNAAGDTILREGMLIGIANADAAQSYSYTESTCTPVMVDYPEGNKIWCSVYPTDNEAIGESLVTLRLCFELMAEK